MSLWRQSTGLLLMLAILAFGTFTGPDARADLRSDANEAAMRGLATIDSLLQVPDAAQAAIKARQFWSQMGDNPIYGWQFEGRLGVALLLSGEPEAAISHLENVVRYQPREPDHHRNLGAALLQLNRRGRALSEYSVAVELDPSDPDLRREYGQMLLAFRDTKGAARELHLARDLCGGCSQMDQPLASLYIMQKDFVRAVPLLRRLYEKDPQPTTRRTLVAAMSQAADDSALVDFIASLRQDQRSGEEWRLLIEAEGRLGQSAHSLLMTENLAVGADAGLPPVVATDDRFWGQVALNLMAAEKFAEGLLAVDRAIELAPQNVIYLNNRVVLLTKLGRDTEARAEWEKVIALDPSLAR